MEDWVAREASAFTLAGVPLLCLDAEDTDTSLRAVESLGRRDRRQKLLNTGNILGDER